VERRSRLLRKIVLRNGKQITLTSDSFFSSSLHDLNRHVERLCSSWDSTSWRKTTSPNDKVIHLPFL